MSQTNKPPLVSIVIPAYNSAWCLESALNSVFDQSFNDYEIIVVNDGSTDNTAEVLAAYKDSIQIIYQENGGLSKARNTGIQAARGTYIAFLDSDDWWLPEKLESQVSLMQSKPELGFCSTATRVQNQQGELLNIWECHNPTNNMLQTIFSHNAAVAGSGSAVMVRRNLLDNSNLFDENLKSFEDIDLWIRLAAVSEYSCISTPLAVILRRENSLSKNFDVMRNSALRSIIKNRVLLPKKLQGSFWRYSLSGVYTDYAKWTLRNGNRTAAISDILMAFILSPIRRSRLCLGLLKDILLRRSV